MYEAGLISRPFTRLRVNSMLTRQENEDARLQDIAARELAALPPTPCVVLVKEGKVTEEGRRRGIRL